MPRNLTPEHMRCAPLHCPAIYEVTPQEMKCGPRNCPAIFKDGNAYLIIGKLIEDAPAEVAAKVGEGEALVGVPVELLNDAVIDAQLTKDLTALVARLCHRLRQFDPDAKTQNAALDFLKRKGLHRHLSVLREVA